MLQRALAALILDDEPPPEEAFGGLRQALLVYRDLARQSLVDPLETVFPVTRTLLGEEAWTRCVNGFLESRGIPSPHHRDIAPAFLGWMADTSWGLDRWPYLLELLHWELLETLVVRFEDLPLPAALDPAPSLAHRIHLDPAACLVAYGHAVHLTTEEDPVPRPGPVQLLAHRDPEGRFRLRDLTPATAILLTQAQERPLGEVLTDLGIQDADPALALLVDLRTAGAIAGFR
jgi:hypothetical protein